MSRIINATLGQRIKGQTKTITIRTSTPLASVTNDDRVRPSAELGTLRLGARLAIYARQASLGQPIGLGQ